MPFLFCDWKLMDMLFTAGAGRIKYTFGKLRTKQILFRVVYICILAGCHLFEVRGQLTARNADGKIPASYANPYGNRDTIFVFNQKETGNLSLTQPVKSAFAWYRFDYALRNFEAETFFTEDAVTSARDGLPQGGYKLTVTPLEGENEPRSFVAWLYMNPGFDFKLWKDNNGEVVATSNDQTCAYTNFRLNPNTVQSSFTYYNPSDLQRAITFDNKITYTMRRENGAEVAVSLLTLGNDRQWLRENDPPYEDMRYYFRAFDMFGIEKRDDIMCRTIIPYVIINQPVLPEKDPTSAPVPVKFTIKPYNTAEYVWRFGDGDSIAYDLEHPAPDTVRHTYKTPKKQDYEVTLKVTSPRWCTFTAEPVKIKVDPPLLEVANVFTPNNDGLNDYFKPHAVSLRGFEIWIYTRTGKQVYHYRGDDLRDWQGWDGRIENSGNDAAEGVYFYTIKALGWDEPPTRNPQAGPYSGFFHLYR